MVSLLRDFYSKQNEKSTQSECRLTVQYGNFQGIIHGDRIASVLGAKRVNQVICENVVSVHTPLATIYSVLIERLGIRNRNAKRKTQIMYQPTSIHLCMQTHQRHILLLLLLLLFSLRFTHIT